MTNRRWLRRADDGTRQLLELAIVLTIAGFALHMEAFSGDPWLHVPALAASFAGGFLLGLAWVRHSGRSRD
jgi:hypothetical protein